MGGFVFPSCQAQGFSIGNPSDTEVQEVVRHAVRKARVLVETIRKYMDVYRNREGWLNTFSAFRLPSPLQGTAEAGSAQARACVEAKDFLARISAAGGCDATALQQLQRIVHRAAAHAQDGCAAKAAWGRPLRRICRTTSAEVIFLIGLMSRSIAIARFAHHI